MSGRLSWLAMAVVLVVALTIGFAGERAPRTETDRVIAIASGVRCPTCASLSAAESDAAAAQAVRDEIRARLRDGQSPAEIRSFLVSRYGQDILLRPEASGIAALVWVLPVVVAVVALAGLGAAFRRWRRLGVGAPSDEDRALVEEALRS